MRPNWWQTLVARISLRGVPAFRRPELLADLDDDSASRRSPKGLLGQIGQRAWWLREVWSLGVAYRREARARQAIGWTRASSIATLLFDLRYLGRAVGSGRGLVLAAILTFAVGLGPSVAVFSLFDRLFLRPLPFFQPERLVQVHLAVLREPSPQAFLPLKFTETLAKRTDIFSGFAWVNGNARANTVPVPGDNPLALTAMTVNALDVLGVRLSLGRGFLPSDSPNELDRPVVLTHEAWQRRFQGSPEVLAMKWTDGLPGYRISYHVVGVLPPDFLLPSSRLMERVDGIYGLAPQGTHPGELATAPFARLQTGVSIGQAQGVANSLAAIQWEVTDSPAKDFHPLTVQPLRSGISMLVRPQLYLVFGAAWLVLLVACVNLTVLLFAWGLARERALGIRLALGAGVARLIRSTLLESFAICGCGSLFAWLCYAATQDAVLFVVPPTLRPFAVAATDSRVLVATLGAAVIAAVAVGVVPARAATKVDVLNVLEDRRLANRRRRSRTFQALLTLETALALVLVIGASSVVPAFVRLLIQSPGFDPNGLFVVNVNHDWSTSETLATANSASRVNAILEVVRHLDGVTSAGATLASPLEGEPDEMTGGFWAGQGLSGSVWAVSAGYFETLRVPVVAGREFSSDDVSSRAMTAVLNEAAVDALWPHIGVGEALGRSVRTKDGSRLVVGVVRNFRSYPGAPVALGLFLPITAVEAVPVQTGLPVVARMIPGRVPDRRLVERALNQRFPTNGVEVQSVAATLLPWLQTPRLLAVLFSVLGAIALLLVGGALFAVVRFEVSRRSQELRIRVALGATSGRLRAAVLSFIAMPMTCGLASGLILSVWIAHVWSASDAYLTLRTPMVYLAAPLAVSVGALVSAWRATAPMVRAMRAGQSLAWPGWREP